MGLFENTAWKANDVNAADARGRSESMYCAGDCGAGGGGGGAEEEEAQSQ